jgi:hypothetical protein
MYPYEIILSNLKLTLPKISNICDSSWLGPRVCLQVFTSLLKPKATNPNATLLCLFINATTETENADKSRSNMRASANEAMKRLERYMPLNKANLATIRSADDLGRHPDFVARASCHEMLKD